MVGWLVGWLVGVWLVCISPASTNQSIHHNDVINQSVVASNAGACSSQHPPHWLSRTPRRCSPRQPTLGYWLVIGWLAGWCIDEAKVLGWCEGFKDGAVVVGCLLVSCNPSRPHHPINHQ
jgi:hypothetical protein